MKASEADLLFVPGYTGSGPDHWQTRWVRHYKTAQMVTGPDWDHVDRKCWVEAVVAAVAAAKRPVVLIGHSMGVATIVSAAVHLWQANVRGAFLVAYADVEANAWIPDADEQFSPMLRDPLPFPSLLIASRTDPYCAFDVADDLGAAWGSFLIDAGNAGHLNAESGHGPWPEGTMMFGKFLAQL